MRDDPTSFVYRTLLTCVLLVLGAGCTEAPDNHVSPLVFSSSDPIRPGEPGTRPFWNAHARRFIYAPAFAFGDTIPAGPVRFILTKEQAPDTLAWNAEAPWALLTPVWEALAPGAYRLTVHAATPTTGLALGERAFIKSPAFSSSSDTTHDFLDSGLRSLTALLHDPRAQTWLATGGPNPDYPLWVHPTKIIGGLVRGMALLATLEPDSSVAREAAEVARRAADFLLALREPEGAPLAHWPPTYWDGVPRGNHPTYLGQHMSVYPAEGAEALLDVFDLTADSVYFDAALSIFRTYARLQRSDGTWPLLLHADTGLPVKDNVLVPTRVVRLLDRMQRQYGIGAFVEMRDRAFAWCLGEPVERFVWEAQFEDTRPKPLYRNMSHREAAELAILLLRDPVSGAPELRLASDLTRYVEDQFVVWNTTDPVLRANFFREGSVWNGNDPETGKDWFLPSAVEQYAFYTPIAGATATVAELYLAWLGRTGDERFRRRAVALAGAITRAQAFHGGGEIPTHLRRTLPELNWINVGVNAATVLIQHADELKP